MRLITMLLLWLMPIAASAQQNPPQPSPTEQALQNKLLTEISFGLQCNSSLIDLRAQLNAAQEELKKLKEIKK